MIRHHVILGANQVVNDNLTAVVDRHNLTIYDVRSKRVFNHIPLERIVRLESVLYRHNFILDQQLPALKLLYQENVSTTMNQLDEIVIKTTRKEWNLPHLLRSRIRARNLGLFYQSLKFDKGDFDKDSESLIKTYLINDKSIVADTCADTVESLIFQTCLDQSAKFKLFSTCLIDILLNEIDQAFKWLKKSILVRPASDIPKFIILKKGGKDTAKMLPALPSPTHPITISNSLYFASLCLDWITSGIYNYNDVQKINIPRLDFSTNESEISILDLVNDISDQLKLYDVDDPSYTSFCTSLCSLASEISSNCSSTIKFTQPELISRNCIDHLIKWQSKRLNSDKDLLHAYRHCELLNYLLATLQISKNSLKKIPDYKYLDRSQVQSHNLPQDSIEKMRLITITNECIFLITQ